MQKFFTLNDLDVRGKRVLVRVAFDVPLDSSKGLLDSNRVLDDSRIMDAIPTLTYLIKNNAKIILAAGWLGRPNGEDPELSMAPVVLRLQEILKEKGLLKHEVILTPNCLDRSKPRSVYRNKDEVIDAVSNLKEGQVIVLENVRYDPEANANDEEFAKFIASLAGNNAIYVNEAEVQNHRPEATIVSVPHYIVKNHGKAVFGFKCAEVIKYIGNISKLLEKNDRGPFVFFLSGKKIETQVGITSKITVTNALLDKMKNGDVLIVQGAVTYTFLLAKKFISIIKKNIKKAESIIKDYNKKIDESPKTATEDTSRLQKEKSNKLKEIIGTSDEDIRNLIGNSFVEWKEIGEQIFFAAQVLLKAKSKHVEVLTSVDHVIANNPPDRYGNLQKDTELKVCNASTGIPQSWLGVAPGPKTLDIISDNVKNAYLLILAGPISIEDERVEIFSKTNKMLFDAILKAKNKGATTIAAGGDTVAIIKRWKGEEAFTLVSNAGGATLELIEKDGKLPGIIAIEEANKV